MGLGWSEYIRYLHHRSIVTADTPNSVMGCACNGCNEARERAGKPPMAWTADEKTRYFILEDGFTDEERARVEQLRHREEHRTYGENPISLRYRIEAYERQARGRLKNKRRQEDES